MIGKTIDVSVTSVLQTTAGKMIFGKWDERAGNRFDSRAALNAVPATSAVSATSTAQNAEPKKTQPIMVERPAE
jgi:hypothetical protein